MNTLEVVEEKEEVNGDEPNLFKVQGVKNPEIWQCCYYVAPTNEKKQWKTNQAIAVYCKVCKKTIPYHSSRNSKGVRRHMESIHADLLESFTRKNSKKRKSEGTLKQYFATKPKIENKASKGNQDKFNKLVAVWTATALRPFSISEDKESIKC